MLTTEKEGLGEKASQGCWGKLQEVTHFSTQNADLLGFSSHPCPTDPWGATSSTLQAPFSGILLHLHGGLRKLGSTQERGGCLGRWRSQQREKKQTLEVIARTRHPPGAEASTWA